MTDKKKQQADSESTAGSAKKLSAAEASKIAAQAKMKTQPPAASVSNKSSTAKQNPPKTGASKSSAPKSDAPKSSVANSSAAKKSPTTSTKNNSTASQGISKIAVLALILALMASAAVAGHFWWQQQLQQQQSQQFEQRLTASINSNNAALSKQLQQQISAQQGQSQQQIKQLLSSVENRSAKRISELEQQITKLQEQQPDNWQVIEAEYLVRMAARVLWLEKDSQTAISLIYDADARLAALKDPQFLSVRQLMHQDIEQLKLLPQLQTDDIILSLMGLAKQVKGLPLVTITEPEIVDSSEDNQLSTDINDWRANLAKSWNMVKENFISIRRRDGSVEPLMAPKFQQNLFNNLELKIQQAQWAASQQNTKLYQDSINDVQQWLARYFDSSNVATQHFNERLEQLKTLSVALNYPQTLASQQALRALIENQSNLPMAPAQQQIQQPKAVPQQPTETEEGVELPTPTLEGNA